MFSSDGATEYLLISRAVNSSDNSDWLKGSNCGKPLMRVWIRSKNTRDKNDKSLKSTTAKVLCTLGFSSTRGPSWIDLAMAANWRSQIKPLSEPAPAICTSPTQVHAICAL